MQHAMLLACDWSQLMPESKLSCLALAAASLAPDAPCFIITWRNLITTLLLGLTSAWRLPFLSALFMVFRASCSTLMRTMAALTASAAWKAGLGSPCQAPAGISLC